jgi:predicted AlkP superfamily phosphohydrolase/phosphomutase
VIKAPGHKLLMIGLDAADFAFIRENLPRLPTLGRIFAEGSVHPLRTTAEHLAGSVWPTFYTGTLPGSHGIGQHIQWDPHSMRMRRVTADWLYCEPFWYELARRGERVTVLDVPFSFESRLERGVEIVNWGSHDKLGAYGANRAELRREIRRRFGHHPMGDEIPVDKTTPQLEAIRRNLVAGAAVKGGMSRWLLQNTDWTFFLTVFGEPHRGGHILWPAPESGGRVPHDALLEVYRAIDPAVGELLAAVDLDSTAIMVFALHGMRSNYSQEHFVRPVMDRINAIFAGRAPSSRPSAPGGIVRRLREAVPSRVQHAAALAVPVPMRDWVVSREVTGGLDWARTPGLALRGDVQGFVRLNLVGREAKGALVPDSGDHRRYLDLVTEGFLSLRDSIDLVESVLPIAELYPGPRNGYLPDLVVRWKHRAPAREAHSERLGRFARRLATGRTGEHRAAGFAVLLGRWPDAARAAAPRHIKDLAGFLSQATTYSAVA